MAPKNRLSVGVSRPTPSDRPTTFSPARSTWTFHDHIVDCGFWNVVSQPAEEVVFHETQLRRPR